MKTDINKRIINFFKKDIEDITIERIKQSFSNIHVTNDYGGLLHAVVHNKFSEKKVLKFMEVLLDNGIDVNLQGKSTGYSFIHLALYGYTDKNGDHSYSTDFIKNLILLAKKYNFDVNIKDNDKDSLIHTALASEVYKGSTIQLIEALGNEYDVLCKDGNGRNIYEALLEYKEEAKNSNKKWYDRLLNEEEEIKLLVKPHEDNVDKSEDIGLDSISIDNSEIVELNELDESNEEVESNSIIEEVESMEEELSKVDDIVEEDESMEELSKVDDIVEEDESTEELSKVDNIVEEDESMEEELSKIDDIVEEDEFMEELSKVDDIVEEDESTEELSKVDDIVEEDESIEELTKVDAILKEVEPDSAIEEELTNDKVLFDNLKTDINKLLDTIDIEYLMINHELILNMKKELVAYINKSDLSIEDKLELEVLQNRFDLLLRIIINRHLSVMKKTPNIEEIDKLLKILELFGYNLELQLLEEIKQEYSKMNEITIIDIEESKTLNDLTIVRKKIENIKDDNYKNNLLEELNKKEKLFLEQMEPLKNKVNFINTIKDMHLIDNQEIEIIDNLDYQNMTIEFVIDLDKKISDIVIENQNVILDSLKRKLDELSMLLLKGEDSELFMKEFSKIENLYDFINSIIKDNSTKVRKRKNG